MLHRLFELEPGAKDIFGLGNDSGANMVESGRFQKHAILFVKMINKALAFLGPDIEVLTEMLLDLGVKHMHYGVKPEYFSSMGHALLYAVEDILGNKCTQQTKEAWLEVYGAMSNDMIRAQKHSLRV
jgi:hemoglobin-like flavoprotein